MSFQKYMQYKALKTIYGANGDLMLDSVLKQAADKEDSQVKNVCALIHVDLFNELENICGVLDISKRKFIELALIEAIGKADAIATEMGVYEFFEQHATDSKA